MHLCRENCLKWIIFKIQIIAKNIEQIAYFKIVFYQTEKSVVFYSLNCYLCYQKICFIPIFVFFKSFIGILGNGNNKNICCQIQFSEYTHQIALILKNL